MGLGGFFWGDEISFLHPTHVLSAKKIFILHKKIAEPE
jgi:hypothetical protein